MSEVMCGSHALNAARSLEDALHAGTRAILISAQAAGSKDREENGRGSSQTENHAFGHGCGFE